MSYTGLGALERALNNYIQRSLLRVRVPAVAAMICIRPAYLCINGTCSKSIDVRNTVQREDNAKLDIEAIDKTNLVSTKHLFVNLREYPLREPPVI